MATKRTRAKDDFEFPAMKQVKSETQEFMEGLGSLTNPDALGRSMTERVISTGVNDHALVVQNPDDDIKLTPEGIAKSMGSPNKPPEQNIQHVESLRGGSSASVETSSATESTMSGRIRRLNCAIPAGSTLDSKPIRTRSESTQHNPAVLRRTLSSESTDQTPAFKDTNTSRNIGVDDEEGHYQEKGVKLRGADGAYGSVEIAARETKSSRHSQGVGRNLLPQMREATMDLMLEMGFRRPVKSTCDVVADWIHKDTKRLSEALIRCGEALRHGRATSSHRMSNAGWLLDCEERNENEDASSVHSSSSSKSSRIDFILALKKVQPRFAQYFCEMQTLKKYFVRKKLKPGKAHGPRPKVTPYRVHVPGVGNFGFRMYLQLAENLMSHLTGEDRQAYQNARSRSFVSPAEALDAFRRWIFHGTEYAWAMKDNTLISILGAYARERGKLLLSLSLAMAKDQTLPRKPYVSSLSITPNDSSSARLLLSLSEQNESEAKVDETEVEAPVSSMDVELGREQDPRWFSDRTLEKAIKHMKKQNL